MNSTAEFINSSPDPDEDIPLIDAGMLHPTVDFEANMGWFPPLTLGLMLACAIVFGFQAATGGLVNPQRLIEMGALSRAEVEQGEVWRMLSATFLHGSVEHLVGNLMMLYVLGLACEHGFGRSQALFLYVVAGLGGSAASLLNPKISVGASGAIFGLAGALITLFRRHRHTLHVRSGRIGIVVGFWALFQIVLGFTDPNIDNLAHIGGFGAGLILGWFLPPAILYDRSEFESRVATRTMLFAACLALIAMSIRFIPRLA